VSKPRPRILVVGAGPAGLSAGVHLLEAAGRDIDVEIVSMGHHLGGKASSWRDKDGYSIDHGFHAVFGFYEEMRALARRAGVDLSRALTKANGRFRYFDDRTSTLEEFRFAHNPVVALYRFATFPGVTSSERSALRDAFGRMGRTIAAAPSLESFDDICYRAFLLQHGVPESVLLHPMFREVYELAFNHPHEISTYIVLKWAELEGHCYYDATYDYFRGGPSELFWNPIASYFQRLGGKLRVREKLVRLEHDNGRLVAARFAAPDAEFHPDGEPWPQIVPTSPGTEVRDDRFSAMICTLPAACFTELNAGDSLWEAPFFGNMKNLSSVSTVSIQIWLKNATPGLIDGTIAALPLPLGYAIDYKRMVPEFEADTRYGAALEWIGVQDGYDHMTEEELIRSARAGLARVPGFAGTDTAEVVHASFRRNDGNHNRYLLTDPGTLRFRPTVKTPLQGLFLAGDWVRNEIEGPSMEGAIRCGKEAARLALQSL
jgi:protoporphyrinogen oxidase